MRSKITLGVVALGLGTALVAAPAFAQNYPIGRAANDGGLAGIAPAQAEKGAERTGSNSNREAFRSGSESYGFGAQGQPTRAPGAYGYR